MILSFAASALSILYAGFLLLYFVPWNFQQADEAVEMDKSMKQMGNVYSLDELSIAFTELFAYIWIVCSIISVYKFSALIFASNSNSQYKYVEYYLFTLVVSVVLSLARHEKYQLIIRNALSLTRTVQESVTICLYIVQIVCSLARGGILHEILCASKSSLGNNGSKLKTSYTTILDAHIFLTSFWCFLSVFYGGLYYDEVRV